MGKFVKQNNTKEFDKNRTSGALKSHNFNKIINHAFIFDLDGVITDTTQSHYLAWAKTFKNLPVLIDKPGIEINGRIYDDIIDGAPRVETIKNLLKLFNIKFSNKDLDNISLYKNKEYQSLIRENGVFLYKDAVDLITRLRSCGTKLGVASSSKNGHEILKMAKIEHYFDYIATGKEIDLYDLNPKPSPDIFNLVVKKLEVDIDDIFIMEDSKVGLRSAIATNCKNVIYADRKSLDIDLNYRYRFTNLTDVLDLF